MAWIFHSTINLVPFVLFSHIALGFPTPLDFNGQLSRWNRSLSSPTVTYYLSTSDRNDYDRYASLVAEAAELWTAADQSYLNLIETADENSADIIVTLGGSEDVGLNAAGYSTIDAYDSDGYMKKCSAVISLTKNPTYTSLSKTILHEIGHCVGLGHSIVSESIMSYDLDKNSFALDVDDEAAIASLYPLSGEEPIKPLGCSVAGTGSKKNGLLLLVLLAPLIVCILKKKPASN